MIALAIRAARRPRRLLPATALVLGTALVGPGCASAAAAQASSREVEVQDPSCGTLLVPLQSNTVIYSLPHGFIRAGTDTVRIRDMVLQRGTDYTIDLLRGELRLLHPPAASETLVVRACWLLHPPPLTVQLVPYRAAIRAAADSATADTTHATPLPYRPATAHNPSQAPGETSLSLSGNKTLAVDFGSQQDAALRQSLDLAVSGTLAPGVELTGVLSDRNTPLTEGGSTQDLQALDRVLIELKAPHGGAALGDVPLAWNEGEFGRIERRLQGVRGEWTAGPFTALAAAATQQGEFRRLQQFGIEGQQGPYLLEDHDGNPGVAVVAGSEVVTVDGERMTRGEGADYSIDYERGRVTFTNRRPITSETRITVDYQVASSSFRRNLAATGGRWDQGPLKLWTRFIQEGDDRGRPLDVELSAEDRRRLMLAGDSTALAIGTGVSDGGGDYDTVRVSGALVYAFAGADSGRFAVQFAHIGAARGDYAESTLVDGRNVFRYVGGGNGSYRIGRPLPLPESHQLWTLGATASHRGVSVDAEGAMTRLDHNTFSAFDDADNVGGAGRARVGFETKTGGTLAGTMGLAVDGRVVEKRFAPFTPLEQPFAEESWGLPLGADLEHQRRVTGSAWFHPSSGGQLELDVGRLATAGGFDALRREFSWARDGFLVTRGVLERADGTQQGARFSDGGRSHARGELGLRGRWIAPTLRAEWDERTSPSDTGRVGTRLREQAVELASGRDVRWRATASYALRHDAPATRSGFDDPTASRALRLGLESPADRRLTMALLYQVRAVDPAANRPRTRSDLGSMRLRAEHKSGAAAVLNVEITSEGESRRERQLQFVGTGRGGYDALGNYVGTGDYDLVVSIGPDFDRLARAATSAHLGAPFGRSERWRGSRVDFDFETDVRRRGELYWRDPVIAPRVVEGDATLSRGSVLQRLSADLAPGSTAGAVFVRLERRVTSDRTFVNFAQVLDDRNASARWRMHAAPALATELELKARRQSADQALTGGASYTRALEEGGGSLSGIWTPNPRWRGVAAAEMTWSRPEGADQITRRLRVGPDLGAAIGTRGHADLSYRRSFTSGPGLLDLLPTADPLGTLRWEGSARLDWRVHETTTFGTSFTMHDRAGRRTQVQGRAELRAFF